MQKGLVIEVNGVRYEAVEDTLPYCIDQVCSICDYQKDHDGDCNAFCCELNLSSCHFKRL